MKRAPDNLQQQQQQQQWHLIWLLEQQIFICQLWREHQTGCTGSSSSSNSEQPVLHQSLEGGVLQPPG
jgi:hypothetical protein